ncbi:hypothetical protein IAD21_04080 [Abditibacteriota bacterium]|nr:hypothetical protein IAD21_04080 [Abditibacteriota bacterium]
MGRAPVRVDIFTGVEGVDFPECWERRITASFEGVTAFILSKADLITAKIASARPQDLLDVAALQDS